MSLVRRQLLTRAGLALAAGMAAPGAPAAALAEAAQQESGAPGALDSWEAVRGQFTLTEDVIHMSAMLIASHPRPVRDAIAAHRDALDASPITYLNENNRRLQDEARAAAAQHLGVSAADIALTDSTTMGVALVYQGLRLKPEDEILTTEQDYFVTHESLRLAARRTGARVRKISLYETIEGITPDAIVARIAEAVTPATRVVALTFVHSSTGLKLPVRRIADALGAINAGRDEDAAVLLCVDGVHGFGVEDVTLADLGCDFLMSGCHKWLFGPRGTGIVAGTPRGWAAVDPTIPSFIDGPTWQAWFSGGEPPGPTTGSRLSPGGFKAFEHLWALPQAFAFQREIGKTRIAGRTHALAQRLKEGLAGMEHVVLHTPLSDDLSAGIVSFDVAGLSPQSVVGRLRERRIIASVAPYAVPRVRLTPSLVNTPEEVDTVLAEVRALAA